MHNSKEIVSKPIDYLSKGEVSWMEAQMDSPLSRKSHLMNHDQYHEYILMPGDKLRAIELRTGIALSANTGISAIFNPSGEAIRKIPFNNQGVFKGEVLLNNGLTFYAKYGNLFSKICLLISLICSFLFKIK